MQSVIVSSECREIAHFLISFTFIAVKYEKASVLSTAQVSTYELVGSSG